MGLRMEALGHSLALLFILLIASSSSAPAQEAADVAAVADGPDGDDMVNAERVSASDGTEAFNQMVAAVNSADERVKGFEGELTQIIDAAENSRMKGNYRK